MEAAADPWRALEAELDAWARDGRRATFWWRDDDATAPGPKLDRMLALSERYKAPLAPAVIPARLDPALAAALSDTPGLAALQHGYAHVNHAPRGVGAGAWELGPHRPIEAVLGELEDGRKRLEDGLGALFLPVVAPPWNRIDPALFAPLAERGYHGVSAFGPRAAAEPVAGFRVTNAHCDPIKWKAERRFAGEDRAVGQVVEHLAQRRAGAVDADEATGLLTHHIDLDEAGWAFTERLLGLVAAHAAARPVSAWEIFAP